MVLRLCPLGLALLLACGGPTPTPPVKMMAFIQAPDGVYKVQPVTLRTLKDVVEMKGDVASMTGNARIVLETTVDYGTLTDAQLPEVLLKNTGGPARASYVEKDGLLWPVDFHTWGMVSTYYNLENAYTYFKALGVPMEALEGAKAPRVFYFADFVDLSQSMEPQTDNAFYFSLLHGFAVLPFKTLQRVPFAMNGGVMAHEYAHRIFNLRVQNDAAFFSLFSDWSASTAQLNLLKSLDEGFADYHGAAATCLLPYGCDTRFFAASLPEKDLTAAARDISRTSHCITKGLYTSLTSDTLGTFVGTGRQYELGGLFAASMYQAALEGNKHQVMQSALLAAYNDSTPTSRGLSQLLTENVNTPSGFNLATVVDVLLQHVTDVDLRTRLCSQFLDRLKVDRAELKYCPASAPGGTTCPAIDP